MNELKQQILFHIKEAVQKIWGEYPESLFLSFPPDIEFGDFTVECFSLAKQFHDAPNSIANKIAEAIEPSDMIEAIHAVCPYLNITVKKSLLFSYCTHILEKGDSFGDVESEEKSRVMVEYLSPNTNKPLHLGHLRNGSIGMAMAHLLEATGNHVIKANLVNDRGVHICKSMLAWQKWGNGSTPESEGLKGDHFVGKWYVRYAQELDKNPDLAQEVQLLLQKWEQGDSETMKLWAIMKDWACVGFTETYKKVGFEFDVFYFESNIYKLGKDIIESGSEKKIFSKNDKGNTVFQLPETPFGRNKDGTLKEVTVLRPDGTSLYITQDIAATILKFKEHNLDRSVFVVGSEQNYYFSCLFTILLALGYTWAKKCYHLSYGMVYLPEGKMKSREGKTVEADDLIDEVTKLAEEEICKRNTKNKLVDSEISLIAAKIAIGAIKYYLLSLKTTQDIHFDPKASVAFDGATGPYCQYAYARIFGILENVRNDDICCQDVDFSLLGNSEERLLLQKLIQFPQEVLLAAEECNPARITTHIFETAKSFNQFYNKHRVISDTIKPELTRARVSLISATAVVLKKGLNILDIDVLETM
ncbi:MAG: arginine--tRNA ligase [bacterium]